MLRVACPRLKKEKREREREREREKRRDTNSQKDNQIGRQTVRMTDMKRRINIEEVSKNQEEKGGIVDKGRLVRKMKR